MKKILIVDDDMMMLRYIKRILSPDYEVVTAGSGREGIEVYAAEAPDLIISDLLMPEMTGFEMQEALHEQMDSTVPLIFMTSDESGDVEGIGFDLGAADFIRKPFHPDALLRRIENTLKHHDLIHSLEAEVSTDKLTGLLNKAAAEKLCTEMCKSAAGMLIILDLDSFKLINDVHGHDMGDVFIRRFAEMIKSFATPEDAAGRLGGDEFILFKRDLKTSAELNVIAEALNRKAAAMTNELLGADSGIPFGVSLGGVLVPDEGTDFAELFRLADRALYSVKQNGRHGAALYGKFNAAAETKRDLKAICRMFEERTVLDGAYRVGLDAFVQLYHYFIRYMQSYCHNAYRLLFTLGYEEAVHQPEQIAESFGDSAAGSLRKSDILVQLSEEQFFLLIPDITEEPLDRLIERIITNWKAGGLAKGVSVSFEYEAIPAEKGLRTARTGDN